MVPTVTMQRFGGMAFILPFLSHHEIMEDVGTGHQGRSGFATTLWSVVLQAGKDDSTQAAGALERLCRVYWYPLYAFARRDGLAPHDAEDATQSFFGHLLKQGLVAKADPARGRFRSFLLVSFKNHLGQMREKAEALKRGGGHRIESLDDIPAEDRYQLEPPDEKSPDRLFERRWAVTLIETALRRLENEWRQAGKFAHFEALHPYLLGDHGETTDEELGLRLGCKAGAARVSLHRFRQRYSEIFRSEVAQTIADPAELEAELQHLRRVLGA